MVRNLHVNVGDIRDMSSVPGSEDGLEEGMATQSSILAWRLLWTEALGRLQSISSQGVRQLK